MGVCCFIGHRKIERRKELEDKVFNIVEDLIVNQNVDTFLFGSRSQFNNLCYSIVTKLKEKYPNIKRIYVRGEYQYIDDKYKDLYFLKGYEDSYLPNCCKVGSYASYVERNYEMIDKSDYCVFYYDKNYVPEQKTISNRGTFKTYSSKTSGTKLAYYFAKMKKKNIVNIKELCV